MNKINSDGIVKYGHNVQITYFAQDQAEGLDINKTIFETVDDAAIGEIRKDLRNILGAFLFTGDVVDKKVAVLSGGERTRLALCLLLLSPSNFLILDEPTNHLDILSKEVLKSALINYEGTFIVVSHDREFLDGLTNRIWDIEDQTLKIHHFGVNEFLQRKIDLSDKKKINNSEKIIDKKIEKNISIDEQKDIKRKKTQLNNQIKKTEENIQKIEDEIKKLDEIILNLDYNNSEKSSKIIIEYENLKKKLNEEMETWEKISDELISINK